MNLSEKVAHGLPRCLENGNRITCNGCRELDDLTAEMADWALMRLGLRESLVRSGLDFRRL